MVKVSDFGLAKEVYQSDYYRVKNKKTALPIRWMSIEDIQYSVFSTQSDVVSKEQRNDISFLNVFLESIQILLNETNAWVGGGGG